MDMDGPEVQQTGVPQRDLRGTRPAANDIHQASPPMCIASGPKAVSHRGKWTCRRHGHKADIGRRSVHQELHPPALRVYNVGKLVLMIVWARLLAGVMKARTRHHSCLGRGIPHYRVDEPGLAPVAAAFHKV